MSSEREQQLLVQTMKQEEELRRLRKDLLALKQATNSPRRPGTAGGRPSTAGGSRGHTSSAAPTTSTSTTATSAPVNTQLYKTFSIQLEPQPRSGQIPTPVEGHSSVAHDGKVTMFGGTSGPYISSDVWQYHVGSNKWKRCRVEQPGGDNNSNSSSHLVPAARYGHTAVLHQGKMIVFGGFGPGGATGQEDGGAGGGGGWNRAGLLNDTFSFDLRRNVWTSLNPTQGSAQGHPVSLVDPVKNHSAVAFRGMMYTFGGCLLQGRTNEVNCFDIEHQKWLPAVEFNLQAASATAVGSGKNAARASAAVTLSNSDVPAPRSGHSANLLVRQGHGSMIVFGGRLGKYVFSNDAFQYDFDSRSWSRLYCGGTIPQPRSGHAASLYKEHLVVFGGYTMAGGAGGGSGATKQHLHDCHVLNTVSCTWTRVELVGPRRPLGLCGHTSILFESPDANICMLTMGGWGVVSDPHHAAGHHHAAGGVDAHAGDDEEEEDGGAAGAKGPKNLPSANCSTLDDIWTITIAPSPPPSVKPAPPRRPNTAGAACRPGSASTTSRYPSAARNRSQSPRNRAASTSGGRNGTGGGDESPRTKAWSTQTSSATTAKLFGDPPHEPRPPCVVPEYQIDSIVNRLRDTRPKEEKLAKLRAQYIKEEEPRQMTSEEQSESVDRLYYQQCEWQQEKKKQLEHKWLPTKEKTTIDEDTANEMVARLGVVPVFKEAPLPPSTTQSHDTTESCVQRLHDFALEYRKKRQEELENKYVWGPKVKRVSSSTSVVDRLTSGGKSPRNH